MVASREFAHLHVHSEFSVLDGLGTVEDYAARAKILGQPAIALTDHGVLCGAPSFYHAARKAEVEPILGCEFYFVPDANWRPTKGVKESPNRYHVVLLAKGRRGYQVLSELSTESHRNFYYKPLLDRAMIEALGKDTRHLVCLSGCAGSIISRLALTDIKAAARELIWWREMFPHFYIELQNHNCDFDRQLNTALIKLAKRYNVPWVITNDPHYVIEEDCDHHDTLLAIQTASDVDDPNRFKFEGFGYHLRDHREMRKQFIEYGREIFLPGMRSTIDIAKACHTRIPEWETRTWQLPTMPGVKDSYSELRQRALAELRRRKLNHDERYVERFKSELRVIKQVGISDFLLITKWCIDEARKRDIPVGPGRGSVCGTLIGFLIGVHKIDPIRYDLMFERFLNPARPKMPDIDTDFGQARRGEMFDIVEGKFGKENVVLVAAYGRMKHKKAFQALGKAYGISFQDRMDITREMPDNPEEGEDLLPKKIRDEYPELAARLTRLNGVRSELKGHPAGVIIADPKLQIRKLVPEMWLATSKKLCGQYDLDAIEKMGLMKQDFLGLRTLDTIKMTVDLINERHGIKLDPNEWIPDEEDGDDAVYHMLAKGLTAGVFQLEGHANTRGIMAIEPNCFNDIVACTALYRSGPISAGYPEQFLNNRIIGQKKIRYAHPLLKSLLAPTWGVILYQEQVMELSTVLAGFDHAGQDDIKQAISKKSSDVMTALRPIFVEGCKKKNNIPEKVSTDIWKDIEGYAGYSFNKSHAVAYSFTTYQTARLKTWWPVEFYTALMATVQDSAKIESYRREALAFKIKMEPPEINSSATHPMPHGNKSIVFGLTDFKGIGPAQAKKIIAGRPEQGYSHISQVEEVVKNVGVMRILEEGGALRNIGMPGNIDRCEELLNWQFRDNMKKWRIKYRDEVSFPTSNGDWCILVGEIIKIDKGKTKNDKPFMTWTIRWGPNQSWNVRMWSEMQGHWSLQKGSIVQVAGEWQEQWRNVTVNSPQNIRLVKRG